MSERDQHNLPQHSPVQHHPAQHNINQYAHDVLHDLAQTSQQQITQPAMSSAWYRRNKNGFITWRAVFTSAVWVIALAHVLWEWMHGGVQSHHFLQLKSMPAMSNWWNLLLLPALAWWSTGRVVKRLVSQLTAALHAQTKPARTVVVGFVIALLYGAALAITFKLGQENITAALFFGMFGLALFIRLYPAQYLMGFVLGMFITFGAIIPIVFGAVVGLLSYVLHAWVYPLVMRIVRR